MGFTRYWYRPRELDTDEFELFATACEDACQDLRNSLSNAVFDASKVSFEGVPPCETFIIQRVSTGRERDGSVLGYCKTEHLPYDEAVERCLILLKKHFPEVTLPEPS